MKSSKANSSPTAESESSPGLPPIPKTFFQYLRSLGPGFVVVLTWLGAGDIVSAGVAGGNYGYALMWAMVLALLIRFLFVSLIARYQLCNLRGEGVVDGLARLHWLYAPFLLIVALLWGHLSCTYMVAGLGEISVSIAGVGAEWMWEIFWVAVIATLILRPQYSSSETIFKICIGILAVTLLGCAIWVGISPKAILKGVFAFELPATQGPFGAMLVAMGMVGAVGGSLMNLVYPYFLDQKGWKGPGYRKLQNYDFLLAVIIMIIFNLAVWTLGAELVFGTDRTISSVDDLAMILGGVLGPAGRVLFLVGVFAAIFTSVLGSGLGLACLASHTWMRWRAGNEDLPMTYRAHPMYRWAALWVVVSPLIWMGRVDFITLTLLVNTLAVLLIPALAGGLWWITASRKFMGDKYKNRWYDNLLMGGLFILGIYGSWESSRSVISQIRSMMGS